MAFIKEYRSTKDEFPEWEYLNSIGVRNFLGEPIKNWTTKKIKFPKNWKFDVISQGELREIITDAFVNETYSKSVTVEKIKAIMVDIVADLIE